MAISAKTLNLPSFHLKKGRDHLINDFLAKSGGSDFLARHTDLLDEYFIECFENSLIGPRMQFHKKPYAIIALGGYGRQEQCLHSDIDILLLFEKKVPGEAEGLIREILYPLWDLGFDVGHATRSIKECLKLAAGDLDVLTALLDARFLCGMSALYARLRELLFQQLTGSRVKKVVAALIQNNHERHDYFGDSSYLLEPNLKEGQGGLRDYHTMLWVARIQSKITRPRDLEYFGYVSCQEFQLLTKALGFIWKVRNHLHHLVRRKFDQLYFEYQKSLALSLNFKKNRGQLPVELFLGKLHAEMEFIKQTNLIFLAEKASYRFLFAEQKKTKKSGRVDGLWVHGKLIGFESTEYIPDFPDLLLKIFIESARLQLALSWEARRVVKEFAYLVDKRFRNDPENVKMFEEILKTPAIPFNVLNEMLQTGFLERFIPAIKSIKNRIQYDGYHFFPIDRHSLRTVKIMKTFADKTITDPLLTGLYRRLGENKTALLWAALLHDIGKGQAGGGHSAKGARIAGRILKNMGYASRTIDTVTFLIENHLFLIKTATRRDTNDEEAVVFCAGKMKSIPRLKMLYLLTVADSLATGPKAWNDWTAELLRGLFLKVFKILEKGELASRKAVETVWKKKQMVLASAVSVKEKKLLESYFDILSQRYLLYAEDGAIAEHIRLYRRLKTRSFVWQICRGRTSQIRKVTICTRDQSGLFSKIAGVFTLNGLDILEAEIYTWKNGVALDIFTVRPPRDLIYEDERWEKAANQLELSLSGELHPGFALPSEPAGSKNSIHRGTRPSRIEIDNHTSSFFTIIEIFADDRPGLLFYLTDTIFRHHLDIRVAKIATKVDQVVDVFYVRDEDGQKVDRPEQIETLRTDIAAVLSKLSAAGQ